MKNLAKQVNLDDKAKIKKKKKYRRRREKRYRERAAAYRDKKANDSGIDGTHDQRPYHLEDEKKELHLLEEVEVLAKQLQDSASLKQQKEAEQDAQAEVEAAPSPVEHKPPQMSEISDNSKTEHVLFGR